MAQQRDAGDSRAEVLGIHFEGPFINPARRGVQPAEFIKLPSSELLAKFHRSGRGTRAV